MLARSFKTSAAVLLAFLVLLASEVRSIHAASTSFIRGDANLSGVVDLSDAVKILSVLFLGDEKPTCEDAMDANDEGSVDISDGVFVLSFLFTGGRVLPAPFPDCGPDATDDKLTCDLYEHCTPCLSPADLSQVLGNVDVCLPAGGPPTAVGPASVFIVPVSRAKPCGPSAAPGWPIHVSVLDAVVNIPGGAIRFHGSGSVSDLPVNIESFISTTECGADITFVGDVILRFSTSNVSGRLVLTRFDSISLENTSLDIAASGGVLCTAAGAIGGFLEELILDQVESILDPQLAQLNEVFAGRPICED